MVEVSDAAGAARPGERELLLGNMAELAAGRRTRELGTTLALQVFRLLRVAQFHALDNMAVIQQLDQTVESIRAFSAHSSDPLSLMFSKGTVFVAGQLLKASRAEYEAALELGAMVENLGLSELIIAPDVDRDDLRELARAFQPGARPEVEGGVFEPSPKIRLRRVSSALLQEEEELSAEDQVLRAYASSVVVMRQVFDNLSAGNYRLPHQAKRLAQKLVTLSEGDTPAYLGVTAVRTLNHDAAGRAVNRAILAVCMGRQVTDDLAALSRIAMAALFLDVGEPWLSGASSRDGGGSGIVTRLTEDEERRLPAATALVLTALGQLRPASMVRSVVAYEAHWLRLRSELGDVYGGSRKATAAARIVAIAHRFNELMSPDLAAAREPSLDEVIAWLRQEAHDATDRAMIALLIGALGIFPSGTPVELSTGERGIVLQSPENPVDFVRPTVQLVVDAQGGTLAPPVIIDLRTEPDRWVVATVRDADPRLRPRERPAGGVSETVRPVGDGMATTRPPARIRSLAPTVAPPPRDTTPQSVPPVSSSRSSVRAGPASDRAAPRSERTGSPVSERLGSGPPPSSPRAARARHMLSRLPADDAPTMAITSPLLDPDGVPDSVEISEIEPTSPSAPSELWKQRPTPSPFKATTQSSSSLTPGALEPSATGSFARTPLSHLLLYLRERKLSGTLVVKESPPDGAALEHAVYVSSGAVSKVVLARPSWSLGDQLVESKILARRQLESDAITQPPTDDALLEREVLEFALALEMDLVNVRKAQVRHRLVELFRLPADSSYAFYNSLDLLEAAWGQIEAPTDPVTLLLDGLRAHPESAAMDRLLSRLERRAIGLVAGASVTDLAMTAAEVSVVEDAARKVPYAELLARHGEATVRRVVYVLVLTRKAVVDKPERDG